MSKYLLRFGLLGTLTFLSLFLYFYKTSGKFRKSIIAAIAALGIFFSGVTMADAAGEADGFTTKPQQSRPSHRSGFLSGSSSNSGSRPGKPDDFDSDGDDWPQFPQNEPVEKTEQRLEKIDEHICKMSELSDSETEGDSDSENELVMSYAEAYNLIKKTYSGSMQITEGCWCSDWQAAKKIYHAKGLGVNPEDYGISQAELRKIQTGGLIKYVQKGNKLPSIEHIRSYQQALKDICLDSATERRDDAQYFDINGVRPTTTFKNADRLVCFDQTTGDLITGDKQREETINKFDETNKLGGQKWIDKWSKK